MAGSRASSNIIAAGSVAAIILAIFFRFQEYGPESTLRKFHEAAARGDEQELGRLVDQTNPEVARALEIQVNEFLRAGARYQLVSMDRSPGQVIANVRYVMPRRGYEIPMVWIVVQRGHVWRIDALKTLNYVRRAMQGS